MVFMFRLIADCMLHRVKDLALFSVVILQFFAFHRMDFTKYGSPLYGHELLIYSFDELGSILRT